MAIVWNVTEERLALTRGYINPDEQRNVDVTQAAEAALISDGALVVVDGSADPPAPTTKTVPVVTTVAFTDPSRQVTLDIPSEATDAELAAAIAAIGGRFRGAYASLSSGAAVKANDVVTNPSGALVSRIADGTISGSYNPANWTALSAGSGAGLPGTVVTKTANYTAAAGEFVLANATGGAFTVTLPSSPGAGKLVTVKKTDASANAVTVVGQGGATIDGDATASIVAEDAGAVFAFDGTNWQVEAVTSAAGPTGATGAAGGSGGVIGQVVVGSGGAATIDFSSIPATYENLRVVFAGRSTAAVNNTALQIRFNNDSAGNYDDQVMAGNAAASVIDSTLGQTAGRALKWITGGSIAAARAAVGEILIPGYARTFFHKSWSSRGMMAMALSSGQMTVEVTGGAWRSTAAIDRVTLFPASGSFAEGTVATLYGEKAS